MLLPMLWGSSVDTQGLSCQLPLSGCHNTGTLSCLLAALWWASLQSQAPSPAHAAQLASPVLAGSINATGRQLDAALTQALQRLDSGGYSKGFQICWGSFPSLPDKQGRNTWQTPQELCQPPPEGSPAGTILQIKLQVSIQCDRDLFQPARPRAHCKRLHVRLNGSGMTLIA